MDNSLGEVIRNLRKECNMTQEDLADGICSTVSLSRIENGMQMPSSQTLDKLLDKLGTSTYQICNIYYKNEKQKMFEERAAEAAVMLSGGDIDGAKMLLDNLRSYEQSDLLSNQTIAFIEGTIALYEAPEASIILLEDALRITKPSINLKEFRDVLFTSTEANILSILAVAYHKNNKSRVAIKIAEELYVSMGKHKSRLKAYEIIRINTAMNLSQFMSAQNRYEEALEYIECAENLSIIQSQTSLLPEIEFLKAGILHKLDRTDESKKIVAAIVPYMELIRKEKFAKRVKDFAEREFDMHFDET